MFYANFHQMNLSWEIFRVCRVLSFTAAQRKYETVYGVRGVERKRISASLFPFSME